MAIGAHDGVRAAVAVVAGERAGVEAGGNINFGIIQLPMIRHLGSSVHRRVCNQRALSFWCG